MAARRGESNLCIRDADMLMMPRHSNNTTPTIVTSKRKRVLANSAHIALVGGSRALAAFQLTPPLGSSILATSGDPQHQPGASIVSPVGHRAAGAVCSTISYRTRANRGVARWGPGGVLTRCRMRQESAVARNEVEVSVRNTNNSGNRCTNKSLGYRPMRGWA
jgi:hypothetical protein